MTARLAVKCLLAAPQQQNTNQLTLWRERVRARYVQQKRMCVGVYTTEGSINIYYI